MKIKKILIFVLFVVTIFLSACGGNSSPEQLWNRYVKAMNSKSVEAVAEVYYQKDSGKYNEFVEKNTAEEYFDFDTISTISFTPLIENDRYYSAEVRLQVDDFENMFNIYFVKDADSPWRFIGEIEATAYDIDITELGNKPDAGYYNNIIQSNDDFDYKYIYGGTPGVPSNEDYIKIVYPKRNSKTINIPDMIDNVPVTFIGDFAFFDYFRIFTVTFSKSKLQEVVLPSQLEIIDSYAFYQTKSLKSIELPSTMKEVRNYAFASSGIEKLVINVDDTAAYEGLSNKAGVDSMTIRGDKVVFMGDTPLPQYTIAGGTRPAVTWSTSDPETATIAPNGRLTMLKTGTVDVIATSASAPSYSTRATVEIKAAAEKTQASTVPAAPFANFKYNIKNVFFVGEEFTTNMSLATTWTY